MATLAARTLLMLVRLLHFLPLPLLAAIGEAVGALLWLVAGGRRRVALRNLELCFPEMDAKARRRMARRHFGWLARSLLERGLLWHASPARLMRLIRIDGDVGLADREPRPVMFLVPHFVGLDVAGVACMLAVQRPLASIYQRQSNAVFDAALRAGRTRFGKSQIFPRSDSVKPLLRAVRQGMTFFNLPDMDFGARDAVFVPFFGVPAATLTAPARIARAADMRVQPVTVELLPRGRGYRVRFHPPWDDFPSDDPARDARRINAFIEQEVRKLPEQYLWVHRRFKTRPAGAPSLY
jgi:KDO2-lipid IV(A) lauroyltransferase